MTRRNPLRVSLSVGAMIAEMREQYAALDPDGRQAAAENDAVFLTRAQRSAVAERNADMYATARAKVKAASALMQRAGRTETRSYGVAHVCPRCGIEARGRSDDQRADWFTDHYNSAHGGH